MQSYPLLHHDRNWYMKIIASLLFCVISAVCYAQKSSVQPLQDASSAFHPEAEDLIDTTNMYNSRYGPVARLTQDNMPCIMPYASAKPIPNAAKRRVTPDEMPNFWKYKRPQALPGKQMPIPESLQKPQSFKAPRRWEKEISAAKPIPDRESKTKFYIGDENPKQP